MRDRLEALLKVSNLTALPATNESLQRSPLDEPKAIQVSSGLLASRIEGASGKERLRPQTSPPGSLAFQVDFAPRPAGPPHPPQAAGAQRTTWALTATLAGQGCAPGREASVGLATLHARAVLGGGLVGLSGTYVYLSMNRFGCVCFAVGYSE